MSAPVQATGIPPVNQTLEPAWVRRGSPATQKAYQSALAFEQTLVEQLSQSLSQANPKAKDPEKEDPPARSPRPCPRLSRQG